MLLAILNEEFYRNIFVGVIVGTALIIIGVVFAYLKKLWNKTTKFISDLKSFMDTNHEYSKKRTELLEEGQEKEKEKARKVQEFNQMITDKIAEMTEAVKKSADDDLRLNGKLDMLNDNLSDMRKDFGGMKEELGQLSERVSKIELQGK